MHVVELRQIAVHAGVFRVRDFGGETELVRAIQEAHGETPCFRTDRRYTCTRRDCRWEGECKKLIAEWRRE